MATIEQAKNGKHFIEAEAGAYAAGDTIRTRTEVTYEETPGLSPRKREAMKASGDLAVKETRQYVFEVTGLGEEYETGDAFNPTWKQRFYGVERED